MHMASLLQITSQELVIEAGRKNQLPLSILDLPGLVVNESAPHKKPIDDLVASFLNTSDDGSYVLPILVGKATDNYNNLRADLVKGRPFVAVLTHADSLVISGVDGQASKHDTVCHLTQVRSKPSLTFEGLCGSQPRFSLSSCQASL